MSQHSTVTISVDFPLPPVVFLKHCLKTFSVETLVLG